MCNARMQRLDAPQLTMSHDVALLHSGHGTIVKVQVRAADGSGGDTKSYITLIGDFRNWNFDHPNVLPVMGVRYKTFYDVHITLDTMSRRISALENYTTYVPNHCTDFMVRVSSLMEVMVTSGVASRLGMSLPARVVIVEDCVDPSLTSDMSVMYARTTLSDLPVWTTMLTMCMV